MRSGRCTRLDTAGNRGFSGASTMPGADVWRRSETSRGLDPDGWLVRRSGVDATGMKTWMRLRWPSGGGVCRAEHNGKKCQKLWKGEVLPLDGSLLMGGFSAPSRCQGSRLHWDRAAGLPGAGSRGATARRRVPGTRGRSSPPPAVVYSAPVVVAPPPVVYRGPRVRAGGYYGYPHRHWRHYGHRW